MAAGEEKLVGRGTEVRTFLYFKVSTPALQKFVPEGCEVCPASSGPAAGANLLAAFVDQMASLVSVVSVPVYARRIFLTGEMS